MKGGSGGVGVRGGGGVAESLFVLFSCLICSAKRIVTSETGLPGQFYP